MHNALREYETHSQNLTTRRADMNNQFPKYVAHHDNCIINNAIAAEQIMTPIIHTFDANMVRAVNNAVALGREANRHERMPRKRAFQTAEQAVSMVEANGKFVIGWVGADRKKHRKTVSDRLQALVIAGSHKARLAVLMLGGTEAEAQTAAASVNTANWTEFVEEVMNARYLFSTAA